LFSGTVFGAPDTDSPRRKKDQTKTQNVEVAFWVLSPRNSLEFPASLINATLDVHLIQTQYGVFLTRETGVDRRQHQSKIADEEVRH